MPTSDDKFIELNDIIDSLQYRMNGKSAIPAKAQAPQTFWQTIRERLKQKHVQRQVLLGLAVWAFQALYFPINKRAKGERDLSIEAIDGRIPRYSSFIVPYSLGFVYLSLMHPIAGVALSRRHFRQHIVASMVATITGFLFWIFFPAKVTKRPFTPRPNNLFDKALHTLHYHDKDYGQYNSFPSSHVYYVAIGLSYLAKEYPKTYWFFYGSSIANAISTLVTHQHYVADAAAGFALSYAAIKASDELVTPFMVKYLGSADE